MDGLWLPPALAGIIIHHARAALPQEVCGLVAGRAGHAVAVYPGRNVSANPETSYELDDRTTVRQVEFEDQGLELVAIYHSHPVGPPYPSPQDVAAAFYPGVVHLICSLADPSAARLTAYLITGGSAIEIPIQSRE